MPTLVRDAIVTFLEKNEGKYFTVEELSEQAKINQMSAGHALTRLKQVGAAMRQKRGDSNAFEYTVGKRLNYAKKYAGRRFPYHRSRADATYGPVTDITPTSVDAPQLGLVFKLNGQAHAITLADARSLYNQLKTLFAKD